MRARNLLLTFLMLTSVRLHAQCAVGIGEYQVTSIETMCLVVDSLAIPSWSLDNAATMWTSACPELGDRLPTLVSNPSNPLVCDFIVPVDYSDQPSPNGYSASFTYTADGSTTPPTLISARITCHQQVCPTELLAHEIGHALGLGNVGGTACAGYLMSGVNPGSNFGSACEVAADLMDPPPPPGEEDPDEGNQCPLGGCPNTPIVVDLSGRGYKLTSATDGVLFDIGGQGKPVKVAWTQAGALNAFLAVDRNQDGEITSGTELFGDATPLRAGGRASNGFEALAEFDENGDGVVNVQDSGWNLLLLWIDSDHDGRSTADELLSIHASSVIALATDYHLIGRRDRFGNLYRFASQLWVQNEAAAQRRLYFDVLLATAR